MPLNIGEFLTQMSLPKQFYRVGGGGGYSDPVLGCQKGVEKHRLFFCAGVLSTGGVVLLMVPTIFSTIDAVPDSGYQIPATTFGRNDKGNK